MKGVLNWLVRWARLASKLDFCPALYRKLFHFISPHRPGTWVASRAGSPLSVSLVVLATEIVRILQLSKPQPGESVKFVRDRR
jgi:hypothetical protein